MFLLFRSILITFKKDHFNKLSIWATARQDVTPFFQLTQERVELVGLIKEPLPHLVKIIVEEKIKEVLKDV